MIVTLCQPNKSQKSASRQFRDWTPGWAVRVFFDDTDTVSRTWHYDNGESFVLKANGRLGRKLEGVPPTPNDPDKMKMKEWLASWNGHPDAIDKQRH